MSVSVIWLKPLSKFVLEVSPLVSALLIGAYLVSGAHEGTRPATTLAAIPEPASAMLSGEAVTAMIKDAHAAVLAESRPQQPAAAALAPVPTQTAAGAPHSARPAVKTAHTPKMAARPMPPATEVADRHEVLPPTAQPHAATEARHGILRRTWGTVTGWSGTVAHATKIDYAADVVAETPAAVARAGRKTWQAFTSILPDDPRR